MNQKLVKMIRRVAFKNTPSPEERFTRQWIVAENKKGKRILLCLDPRASYKAMKNNFKNGSVSERLRMRKEVKILSVLARRDFPRGVVFGAIKTYLGNPLPKMEA